MDVQQARALTDDVIDSASGEDLRRLATDHDVSHYDTHRTVFSLNLTPEVLASPAALTAVGKAIEAVNAAYERAGLGPKIDNEYNSATIKVWQDDRGVRQSIKWARDRELKD